MKVCEKFGTFPKKDVPLSLHYLNILNNNTIMSEEKNTVKPLMVTLKNPNGMEVTVMEYGAIITSIKVPVGDKKVECVLGFDTYEEYRADAYLADCPYLGAVIGRNAGRIKNGKVYIGGEAVQLSQNLGEHQIHGGVEGFDKKLWKLIDLTEGLNPSAEFEYISPDGEEGYPGNVTVRVRYTLTIDNCLRVDYEGQSDKPTILNLTQHTYFNLSEDDSDILKHRLQIHSNYYMPLAEDSFTPTGEILPVKGTPFDYTRPKAIYEDTDRSYPAQTSDSVYMANVVNAEKSIRMLVRTNYPVLHIYAGYYLPNFTPEGRKTIGKNRGLCFEAQFPADATKHPDFPSVELSVGALYKYFTEFRFVF